MAKRINKFQLTGKYWPAWRAAEKALIASGTYDKKEAEALRKEITGVSSKDLTNRQLDECLKKFLAISQPTNGKAQADQADQPLKRLRYVIAQAQARLKLPDTYIETMAVNIAKSPYQFCNEEQLKKILVALQIHENRHNQSVAS